VMSPRMSLSLRPLRPLCPVIAGPAEYTIA
jgi:hypothetical protein